MKREVFFVFAILLCISLNQFIYAETTDNSITGKATSQQIGISIFVQTILPYVEIISPKNNTYLTNESLLLNYTSINTDYVWYNIDNLVNATLTSSVLFNVSQGTHTIYIFANNTNASTQSSVTFTANSSIFIILFEHYKNTSTKGSSTNFINHSYEEIQALNDIILENTNYGKIEFNETINMTNDKDFTDNLLDIDSNILMSSNHIELNTTEVPNFNKSATLWLYNLSFTNPRILKNGVVCPSTACIKESYSFPSGIVGGNLKFNVTSFSVYSAEETPPTTITTIINEGGGGGGGGGGGVVIPANKYSLNPEQILVYLKQGETTTKYFTIENTDTKKLDLTIKTKNLEDLVAISETKISLNPKESKVIRLDFLARNDTIPNLYLGKIIVSSSNTEKDILVMMEIESKSPLFDIKMRIPNKYQYVLPGEEISAQIELYNLGHTDRLDVFLDYIIKDSDGNEVIQEHDSMAIETSANFVKNIQLPKDLAYGKYVFYVRVNYDDKIASASAWFNVNRMFGAFYKNSYIFIIFLIIVVILLIFSIIAILKKTKEIKKYLNPEDKNR